jgi:hypothetical protein
VAAADVSPGFTEEQVEKGLKPGALGLVSSVVMGVASTAPAYSLAATLGFIVAVVGLGSPIVAVIAFVPIFLTSIGYSELNKADPDCGLLANLLKDGLAGFRVGDVALERDGIRAELGDRGVEGLLIAASDGDLCAFLDEETGGGEADAAVASGDKGFLSCEFHVVCSFGFILQPEMR